MGVSDHTSDSESVKKRLTELINKMSEEQRIILLKHLEDMQSGSKRKHDRKSCQVAVHYAVEDRAFKDYITNISPSGVFIETDRPLYVGQEILMSFTLTERKKPFTIKGRIVRIEDGGIGVSFEKK